MTEEPEVKEPTEPETNKTTKPSGLNQESVIPNDTGQFADSDQDSTVISDSDNEQEAKSENITYFDRMAGKAKITIRNIQEDCERYIPQYLTGGAKGVGRGNGGATKGPLKREGPGRNENMGTLEQLEEDIQNGKGVGYDDVIRYRGFYSKIGGQDHRTQLVGPNGKEGLKYLDDLYPNDYVSKDLRDGEKTHTDEKGFIKGYKKKGDGSDVELWDASLISERRMEIWRLDMEERQKKYRPTLREKITNQLLTTPILTTTKEGVVITGEITPKNQLLYKNSATEEIAGVKIRTEEVRKAAIAPLADALCGVVEHSENNPTMDRVVYALEALQAQQVQLEYKMNLTDARTTAALRNRPTRNEVNLDLHSEKQSRMNLVLKIGKYQYDQLKNTGRMEDKKDIVAGWFNDSHNSVFETVTGEWFRVVGYSRIPRNEDGVLVIITFDSEERANIILTEYRRKDEQIAKYRERYQGSDLERIHQKLGRITPFKSRREIRQDDDFFEKARKTNDINIGILMDQKDKSLAVTKGNAMKGEIKKVPKRINTTSRGNDSKGASTFQMEYLTFRAVKGNKDGEWLELILRQIKYIEAGMKRGITRSAAEIAWLEGDEN